jgi:hypothetical protein
VLFTSKTGVEKWPRDGEELDWCRRMTGIVLTSVLLFSFLSHLPLFQDKARLILGYFCVMFCLPNWCYGFAIIIVSNGALICEKLMLVNWNWIVLVLHFGCIIVGVWLSFVM